MNIQNKLLSVMDLAVNHRKNYFFDRNKYKLFILRQEPYLF